MEDVEFWKFVVEHAADNPGSLRLKYHGKDLTGVDIGFAITQIECRQRFGRKLAETLSSCPHFLFPDSLVGEQSTSDAIATVHVGLSFDGFDSEPGRSLRIADLTAGLGIDAFHLARAGAMVTAVELDPFRAEIMRQNALAMGLQNVEVITADCTNFIETLPADALDITFIDPARRDAMGGRVFSLSDCQPDVLKMLPLLRHITRRLVVKMSPMLDATAVASSLGFGGKIVTIGTTTECKELVAVVDFDKSGYEMSAVTLGMGTEEFLGHADGKAPSVESAGDINGYLYEPYPAVMKLSPFAEICKKYGVRQLHDNSHLFCSNHAIEDFPGERFEIKAVLPWRSSEIKRFARKFPRLSVTARNFPMSADALRKKLRVAEGPGDLRLFATTVSPDTQVLIVGNKVN